MAKTTKLPRAKLVSNAHVRFLKMLEFHDTAVLFSRYAKLIAAFQEESDEGDRGLLFATEYELLDELYRAVFAEDLKRAKELTGNKTGELMKLFQEVMSGPLSSASSEPISGA